MCWLRCQVTTGVVEGSITDLGKVLTVSGLPGRFRGLELDNVTDYFDALVFARQILVDGLTRGPLATQDRVLSG